jgi:hypothetical protein
MDIEVTLDAQFFFPIFLPLVPGVLPDHDHFGKVS